MFDMTLQENPGLSISRQASKRMRVLKLYGGARLSSARYLRLALEGTRKAAGSRRESTALVVANGPSAARLDPSGVKAACESGMDVLALNAYILTDLADDIRPTHYVLSDPSHHPDADSDLAREIWRRLDARPDITVIAPHTWFPTLSDRRPSALFFNDCGLQGWTRNISPLRAMGYTYLTAYKALAFALHLGYHTVNIIGFDNSIFAHVAVDEHNRMSVAGHTHFYSGSEGSANLSSARFPSYPLGMADWLFDFSLCFYDLKRMFGEQPIVNLDPHSLTDAFRKVTESSLLRTGPSS